MLYLVDTFSLIFQVYYAIRQPMTGTRGQPTNAVYGFTGDLEHLIKEMQPTHLICAMESSEEQERVAIYDEYKAHREEMPDDLRPQIDMILDVIQAYNIPIIQAPGWEADDVIATLATRAAADGMDVRIVSNDKDLRQLIGPKVKMYNIRKRQFQDEEHLLKEWGITPEQVIDFQSLVGDSVDNVPGVPLVGPKKASALIEKFGTLENILANADQAPGKKLAENLKTYANQARMSRDLVTLRTDLDLNYDWDEARISDPNREQLLELFEDFGFRRYADAMRTELSSSKIKDAKDTERQWTTIDTEDAFAKFVKELSEQQSFCVDLETTSQNPLRADIVGWAFCWEAHQGYYIPVDAPPGTPKLDHNSVLNVLRPFLEDPQREIVNQNIKYDMLVLRRAGVALEGVGMDPMIGDYLLDAGARGHSLDDLSKRYLSRKMIPISDLIGKGKKQLKMFEVEVDRAAEYASEDADITWQVADIITDELKSENLWDLYWDLERPLISVLTDMEFNGITVDVDELNRQSNALVGRLDALMHEIYDGAGHEFNLNSPKQLATVLFEEMGLPVIKRTKTGASTNEEVLTRLAADHPLPAKIIEHRQLTKLKGTYLDALPTMVNPETGRIHTSFSQTSAATGRLASSDPNLQNIPIRTEEGRKIRRAFVASSEPRPSASGPVADDWQLVCMDYSQIELRILAHFCQDPALMQAFRDGKDIHRSVASQVYGVSPEDVDSDMRRVAKAVNFGVIYGQTAFGLANALGIEKESAEAFIDDYFAKYAGVARFIDETLEDCHRSRYATTILGRRREITGIREERYRNLNLPERTAVNTVIQGSAADLIKKAMLNVHAKLSEINSPARMLLQIHDELVFECPRDEFDNFIPMIREKMESALPLDVPIVVDVSVGRNWLETEVWETASG
ncbi:MAG: DNA polymerase I [Planctomycetaceae bacterium]|nr:DNA polymerase I [Planctomycetaceae bacterium]